MAQRECLVRFRYNDATHEVQVSAERLYEAAARALCTSRENAWASSDAMQTGCLEIIVRQPEIRHTLLVRGHETDGSSGRW